VCVCVCVCMIKSLRSISYMMNTVWTHEESSLNMSELQLKSDISSLPTCF